jgi:cytoskeleton protein RodZ
MAAVAAVVVAGIALLALYPRDAPRSPPQSEADPALPIAAVPATGEKSAARKAAQDKPSPRRPQAQSDGADRVADKVTTSSAAAETPAGAAAGSQVDSEVAQAAAQPADAIPRKTLRMIFDQESWVEIKDRNGNTVFGQLNAAGTRRSASGEPPLTVVVGNAAGVRMFVGNESFDLAPHTRVDVARFTVE